MRVEKVMIERAAAYLSNAGELVGVVVLYGPDGRIEVPLSKDALGMVCSQIAKEVRERAEANVRGIKPAFDEVVQGALTMD